MAPGETGRATSAACHLVAREALEPMTATLREGGLCCSSGAGSQRRADWRGAVFSLFNSGVSLGILPPVQNTRSGPVCANFRW